MEFRLSNLTYSYNRSNNFTLGPIDCSIDSSAITAIIGANGSGKSTLIKVLLRQHIEYLGSYSIDGVEEENCTGDILHQRKIGYLPEVPILDDHLTGFELVSLVKELREIPDDFFKEELEECEELLGIEEWFYSKRCREYSLGMQKKTAIAMAVLGNMNFLILDEPTNGLDPLAVFGLKQLIRKKHEAGTGILVTSHMLDFLEKVVDQVVFLKNGSVVHQDSLESLLEQWGTTASLDEIYFEMHTKESVHE